MVNHLFYQQNISELEQKREYFIIILKILFVSCSKPFTYWATYEPLLEENIFRIL